MFPGYPVRGRQPHWGDENVCGNERIESHLGEGDGQVSEVLPRSANVHCSKVIKEIEGNKYGNIGS